MNRVVIILFVIWIALCVTAISDGVHKKEVVKEYELVQCGFITKCLPMNRYPTKETCEAMIKMQDQAMLVYACIEKDRDEDDTL